MSESLCPVTFVHQGITGLFPKETYISEIIRSQNIQFAFPCNGRGRCSKCRVKAKGWLSEPSFFERRMLSAEDMENFVRLACQTRILGPVELELDGVDNTQHILSRGTFDFAGPVNSIWGQYLVDTPPVLSWEKISKQLPPNLVPALETLRQLGELDGCVERLFVETLLNQAVGIHSSEARRYGVAIDIGTTTLAAYLVDLSDGNILGTSSAYNPQSSYGADVISRIGYAGDPKGLETLHRVIIEAINGLINRVSVESSVSAQDILIVNIVGNSSMIHFLLKVNPAGLGKIPFEPVFKSPQRLPAWELAIAIHPAGLVTVLPGIGGFVGSDIASGVLACRMRPDQTELLIDIGTNGEVVVTGKGRMMACSTAAGPAFEGANISCGMLAGPGAIVDLAFEDAGIRLTTLDGKPARGICGTGLIRIIVELLRKGIITDTGRFNDETDDPHFSPDEKRYYLTRDGDHPIFLSQADVRQFQLAKGAIRAGLDLMLAKMNILPQDLQSLYIAGAFGNYMNPEDALFLGLLPNVPLNRIKIVGNTAGLGAVISMISQDDAAELAQRVAAIDHVELANDPGFMDAFTEAMMFPEV